MSSVAMLSVELMVYAAQPAGLAYRGRSPVRRHKPDRTPSACPFSHLV